MSFSNFATLWSEWPIKKINLQLSASPLKVQMRLMCINCSGQGKSVAAAILDPGSGRNFTEALNARWKLELMSIFFFFMSDTLCDKIHAWQHTLVVPAWTSLTAQSPGLTPFRSPSGPMHRVAATAFPVRFSTCTAHSASSTCSKY